MRQRCVADGKQVNIPVPMFSAMGGRRKLGQPTVGIVGLSMKVENLGKSGFLTLRCDDDYLRVRSG